MDSLSVILMYNTYDSLQMSFFVDVQEYVPAQSMLTGIFLHAIYYYYYGEENAHTDAPCSAAFI